MPFIKVRNIKQFMNYQLICSLAPDSAKQEMFKYEKEKIIVKPFWYDTIVQELIATIAIFVRIEWSIHAEQEWIDLERSGTYVKLNHDAILCFLFAILTEAVMQVRGQKIVTSVHNVENLLCLNLGYPNNPTTKYGNL